MSVDAPQDRLANPHNLLLSICVLRLVFAASKTGQVIETSIFVLTALFRPEAVDVLLDVDIMGGCAASVTSLAAYD